MKKVALAPKNQNKTTSDNNLKEKSVMLNLSCIPSRGNSLHTHPTFRKGIQLEQFLGQPLQEQICLLWIQNKQHCCIPSSANSRSTKFNSRIFQSFCVMYDEETINKMITAKAIESFTKITQLWVLGFPSLFPVITVLGFCEGFCFVVEGDIVLLRRGGRRGIRRWRWRWRSRWWRWSITSLPMFIVSLIATVSW